jgi:hypothetical protein
MAPAYGSLLDAADPVKLAPAKVRQIRQVLRRKCMGSLADVGGVLRKY